VHNYSVSAQGALSEWMTEKFSKFFFSSTASEKLNQPHIKMQNMLMIQAITNKLILARCNEHEIKKGWVAS